MTYAYNSNQALKNHLGRATVPERCSACLIALSAIQKQCVISSIPGEVRNSFVNSFSAIAPKMRFTTYPCTTAIVESLVEPHGKLSTCLIRASSCTSRRRFTTSLGRRRQVLRSRRNSMTSFVLYLGTSPDKVNATFHADQHAFRGSKERE